MELYAPSGIQIALEVASVEVNRTQDEENAVVAAIKAGDLLHRTISDYLLRDIVKATIKVLSERQAERMGADPA